MNFDAISLFALKTRVFYGYNSINLAGTESGKLGITKALVVTDQGIRSAGVLEPLLKSLELAKLSYEIFADVPVDPDSVVVDKGVTLLKQIGGDGVIIVGGGSPLCAGKGIALVATNGGNIRDYEGVEKYKVPPLPVIAIPTTAGSGSEVSASFILSDETRNNHKMAINGYHCFPDVAILDPLLLRALPPYQFILSGIDALTHAMEALWTNQGTPLTDALAYEAIRLIMDNLTIAAYTDNLEAKSNQLFASTIANIACGNAKLGLLHAMTQPLGKYNLSHGLVNAIYLPYVMEYNFPACERKLAAMAEAINVTKPQMSLSEKATAAVNAVKELLTKVNLPDRVAENVIPKADISGIAEITMKLPQTARFNIRRTSKQELVKLYERAYQGWR